MTPEQILTFWFADAVHDVQAVQKRYKFWFEATPETDQQIHDQFLDVYYQARSGALETWQAAPHSCLALLITLDQFPRNLFRGTPEAFATDSQAQQMCQHGLRQNYLSELNCAEQLFFLMPLQHAEDVARQEESLRLSEATLAQAPPDWHEFLSSFLGSTRKHLEIIQRFGRFPHRNVVLGRESTPEEQAFLDSGGGSFGQAPAARSGK